MKLKSPVEIIADMCEKTENGFPILTKELNNLKIKMLKEQGYRGVIEIQNVSQNERENSQTEEQ